MRAIFLALLCLSVCLLQMTQGHRHRGKNKKKPCCGGHKTSVSTDNPLAPKKMANKKVDDKEPAVEETKKEGGGCCQGKKNEHLKQAAAAASGEKSADDGSPSSFRRLLTGWNLVILLGGIVGVLAVILALQRCITGKK